MNGRYKTVKFRRRFTIANPSNFIFPEIFEELDKIIYFSEAVRDAQHRGLRSGSSLVICWRRLCCA